MGKKADLEINEDLEFQRKSWIFQRIGMVFLIAIVVLSILGLGGNGPLSKGTAESTQGSYKISFEKISRLSSPSEITIALRKDLRVDDTLRVRLEKTFFNAVELQDIIPEPAEQKDDDKFIELTFTGSKNTHPNTIHISYQHRHYGSMEYSISINNDECNFKQFIWP